MSKHLWMYEGLNISLIFSKSIKVNHWRRFITAFQTKWSARCNERHHVFHYNECKRVETALQRSIHQRISKGSLIGMCLDIIIREKAREKRHSWFDAKLANEYGVSKPFNDNELLLKSALTYPEVGDFLPFMLLELLLFHTKLTLQKWVLQNLL
jgi:hypothetical protein